ncbi:MAG: antitoxin Xre/MbcA/ParS toxin-binding domain-containing protein [Gemmatimonadaceae bacterium]
MAKTSEGLPRPRESGQPPEVRAYWKAVRGPHGPHVYASLLGIKTHDITSLHYKVEKGIEYRFFEKLLRIMELQGKTIADVLLIPTRTVHRRKAEGRLRPDESDRVLRLARLYGRAIELFEGDSIAALQWLRSPAKALGSRTPLSMSKTDPGAIEVERLIGRLEHGVFS